MYKQKAGKIEKKKQSENPVKFVLCRPPTAGRDSLLKGGLYIQGDSIGEKQPFLGKRLSTGNSF